MEFYKRIEVPIPVSRLQQDLNLLKLSRWCSSINEVLAKEGNRAVIHSDWGTIHVHRELIQNGVRFSVTDDPTALQWTVTSDGDVVMIHATINSIECGPEIQSRMDHFMDCWQQGVEQWPVRHAMEDRRGCVNCGESFGGFG